MMNIRPIRQYHHSLQTDAGESMLDVVDSYPVLIQSDVPGYYYQWVTLEIKPCVFAGRWQTLSQWERVRAESLDGLGTV